MTTRTASVSSPSSSSSSSSSSAGRRHWCARRTATTATAPRRRGRAVAAFDAVPPTTTTFSLPPLPLPTSSLTRVGDVASSATIDAQSAETLVDAFEALPRDERIKLVERAVFGTRGRDADADDALEGISRREVERVADDGASVDDVKKTSSSSISADLVRDAPDVRIEAREAAAAAETPRLFERGLTDEELDLREFGEPSSDGLSAWSDAALVEKWREVFGEDPPENSASGIEDILGADVDDDENIVARVRASVSRASYAVERAWTKLVYRFGRQGAIVASGFVSVAIVVGFGALFGGQSPSVAIESSDDEEKDADVGEAPLAEDISTSTSEAITESKIQQLGALWERKSDAGGDIVRPPVASGAGVLWTRKEDGEKAPRKSARDRMGPPPSGTFDDRDRLEPPKKVLWTRKNDPEFDDMDEVDEDEDENENDIVEDFPEPRTRRNVTRRPAASDLLDDNLEDLRAFRRKTENSSDPR